MPSDGTGSAGLPATQREVIDGEERLTFQYVRRIGSGLTYIPEVNATLDELTWEAVAASPVIEILNANWERLCVHAILSNPTRRFGRLRVEME